MGCRSMCGPRFSPGRGFGQKSRRGPRDLAWVFPATTVGMPEGRRARKLAPEAAIPRRCECSGLWGQPHRLRPALPPVRRPRPPGVAAQPSRGQLDSNAARRAASNGVSDALAAPAKLPKPNFGRWQGSHPLEASFGVWLQKKNLTFSLSHS